MKQCHSKERSEEMRKAKMHGAKFLSTGVAHLTTDDFFIAHQNNERKKELKGCRRLRRRCLCQR